MGLAVPTENMSTVDRQRGQIRLVSLPLLAASTNKETKPKFPLIYI